LNFIDGTGISGQDEDRYNFKHVNAIYKSDMVYLFLSFGRRYRRM